MTTKALDTQPRDWTRGNNGSVSGYFATFDHDHGDSYGDVIRRGSFLKTIAARKKSGHPFPLCYNHDITDIIGYVTDIGEDTTGAYFTAEFFPTEKAQEIRHMVLCGVLRQFSFAYNVVNSGKVRAEDGTMVNELREVDLYEISVVAIPANPRATITDIKTPGAEAQLRKLRRMEDQALKDIGAAEAAGLRDWKAQRMRALNAIRAQIGQYA